jgi:hypothetical protein
MMKISATKPGFRGGRPKLVPEDVRKSYGVRMSARERQEIRGLAKEAGLDFSTYCRNAILNAKAPRPVPAINLKAWLELNSLAEAVVSLSKKSHSDDAQLSPEQFDELRLLLKSTRLALLGIHHVPEDEI